MKKNLLPLGISVLLALGAQASQTNLFFTPGNLIVMRGGDGVQPLGSGNKQNPMFLDEYNTVTNSQLLPIVSEEMPTNGAHPIWFNASAGSEGQGLTRSADRRLLTITGYTSPINEALGTPSSEPFNRGFGVVDTFSNLTVVYSDPDNWYGMPPGVTQDNPRGIATLDGTNFWGVGTVAGTQSGGGVQETGTLFYNPVDEQLNSGAGIQPAPIQTILSSMYYAKIINGVLCVDAKIKDGAFNNGIYSFSTAATHTPDPLPWVPGVSPAVTDTTNLICDFTAQFGNILTFDMDDSNQVVYAADNQWGIIKYTNNGAGGFNFAYYWNSNNLETAAQLQGNQGCFGLVVDFSQSTTNYNIIYATTMENGDGKNVDGNRLIRIVDIGAPDSVTPVEQTLAKAQNNNEDFRGLAFSPDVRPFFIEQPQSISTIVNQNVSLNTLVSSPFTVTYQWQQDGTNLTDGGGILGSTSNILTFQNTQLTNDGNYFLVASNKYGSVTSSVANVTITTTPVLPVYTNAVALVTNFVGNIVSLNGAAEGGTEPFTYQWYFGTTQLSDGPNGTGSGYTGSGTATLIITNAQLTDSGNYYATISNPAGSVSNEVVSLTIQYLPPSIPGGQQSSLVMLQGGTGTITVASVRGTPPLSYQWYIGKTNAVVQLSDVGEYTGTGTNVLTITGASLNDATNYFCVVTNLGGAQTNKAVKVTVLVPPALSFVGYSNQVYTQNFDSLPNPFTGPTVNTVGGGGLTTIGSNTYWPANPFDFAFPTYTNITLGAAGGLGLSNTMPGWYGECDGDTAAEGGQVGATWGDQTTGGILSFGLTNTLALSSNRALGLIATSTSGGTHFGLKLINTTTNNLNYFTLACTGEYWKLGTKPKNMLFTFLVDPAGNGSTLSTNETLASQGNYIDSLSISNQQARFPLEPAGPTNGTLAFNQIGLSTTNFYLGSTPWTPGSALWLIWSINDASGSGQGYGIDNLSFSAVVSTNIVVSVPQLTGETFSTTTGSTFSFTNIPGAAGSFTVWSSTNVALPLAQWQNMGNPTEVSPGNYQFNDSAATGYQQRFYIVTSP